MSDKETNGAKVCCESTMDLQPINVILGELVGKKGMLIPVLQKAQKEYGYLPELVLLRIAEELEISPSEIYGVATFYAQFYLEPRGRHVVRICRGTACHVKGATKITDIVAETLGVGVGESTEDMKFVLEDVACIGACGIAPVMMIDEKTYGSVTVNEAKEAVVNFVPPEED